MAQRRTEATRFAVVEARGKVKGAQTDLNRIETLIERMVDEERTTRDRMARKLDDEVAARQSAEQRKKIRTGEP